MGWWVSLRTADGRVAQVAQHQEGGVHSIFDTMDAELSITFNYNRCYQEVIESYTSLRDLLNGQRADMVTPILEAAIALLGTERHHNYWLATPGNAGAALAILLDWARQCPNGTFEVEG
jgi:hypothetical protein